MTEREQLLNMLSRLTDKGWDAQSNLNTGCCDVYIEEQGRDSPIYGYAGFFTVWTFDRDGKLIAIGVWE